MHFKNLYCIGHANAIDAIDSYVEIEQPELPTNTSQTTHMHVFAEAFEVKSHEIDKSATAECFSNMIGIGTRFA